MPANSFLQRFLPFFRQFCRACPVCCLRLQPFLTERMQHFSGDSPLLQRSPSMKKHWPLRQKPPGHCRSEVQPPGGVGGDGVPSPHVPSPRQIRGLSHSSPSSQQSWPRPPHATQVPSGPSLGSQTAPSSQKSPSPGSQHGKPIRPHSMQVPPAEQVRPAVLHVSLSQHGSPRSPHETQSLSTQIPPGSQVGSPSQHS